MLRYVLAAIVVAALAPVAAMARTPAHAELWNGAEINWRDPKSGIYEASSTGRPVLMLMHATWCGACKAYRAIFKDPEIVKASRDFVMILVDVDTEKQINGAFSPDGTYVPRTLFIDANGDISKELVGKDPKYPHTIDLENSAELLSLMRKAKGVMKFPEPPQPAAGENKT